MDARNEGEATRLSGRTVVKRTSDRELVVTRRFNGPARIVFEAWSRPELLMRWWVPKSLGMSLVSCEADVRTGGTYRFDFGNGAVFFGRYIDVIAQSRIVWTNEESEEGSVTTVTLEEKDGKTLLTLHELYPSKEALDASDGAAEGMPEQFEQLDELLVILGTGAGRS